MLNGQRAWAVTAASAESSPRAKRHQIRDGIYSSSSRDAAKPGHLISSHLTRAQTSVRTRPSKRSQNGALSKDVRVSIVKRIRVEQSTSCRAIMQAAVPGRLAGSQTRRTTWPDMPGSRHTRRRGHRRRLRALRRAAYSACASAAAAHRLAEVAAAAADAAAAANTGHHTACLVVLPASLAARAVSGRFEGRVSRFTI